MSNDDNRRIAGLVARLGGNDFEAARSAQRALRQLVRHAGRPGAETERAATVQQLLPLADPTAPAAVRRETLRLLGEIGSDDAVPTLTGLLSDPALCEEARMALERIGGERAIDALQIALRRAPEGFRPAIAESLRALGVAVSDYPSVRMKPVKATSVRQVDKVVG
jgi:HEAT repeat protein